MTLTVPSTDGVDVAVHDLGGTGPMMLASHATGFHGRCYEPLARCLQDVARTVALDHRGHGATAAPPGWAIDWVALGHDTAAVAEHAAGDQRLVGFGHSMGGATLLMAARLRPSLFRSLVLFEPVVFPPGPPPAAQAVLAARARRRRGSFPSLAEAYENYAAKPPLGSFTPEALHAYVDHGFRRGSDGQVHLLCSPEVEAGTFEASTSHHTWDDLPNLHLPVWVVAGRSDGDGPASVAPAIAQRLPSGTFVQLEALDHFGPMTHPCVVADVVREALVATGEGA